MPLARNGTVVVSSNDTSAPADGCDAYNTSRFAGKIALIRRGTCFFVTKALNAQAAGAIGVIIYNRLPGRLFISATDPELKIPVAGISKEDGEVLVQRSLAAPVQISWLSGLQMKPNPTGGQVSSFSGWGPNPNLGMTPDLGAPGGYIYSTVPRALGSYDFYSGTSMASPYAAGIAALYLSSSRDRKRKTTPSELKQVLQNSAVPVVRWEETPAPCGSAGRRSRQCASCDPREHKRQPSALPLGFLPNAPMTVYRNLTIQNKGSVTMTYNIRHVAAAAVDATYSDSPELFDISATVCFPKDCQGVPQNDIPSTSENHLQHDSK